MNYRHVISRRAVLRGGAIAIGLPFLESMIESSAHGQTANVPIGMVSLMHGLGTPDIFLDRGLAGTLQYYQSLISANKISIYTNIDSSAAADQPVVAQHHYGQPYLFSGYRTKLAPGFNVIPQGPTLHFSIMKQNYPQGGVPTRFRIIDTGIYFRRGINYQYKRIWNDQGSNAADFEDLASPVDFFDKIFGTMPAPIQQDPKARAARSILDYLIPSYQKYTGSASPLPTRDAAVLSNHLDRIRQLELSVYGSGTGGPPTNLPTVTRPMPPPLNYMVDGASCGDPANVYKVSPADFQTAYQILADLWIAGLECDYYRFGNLSLDSGGGQTNFVGPLGNPDDLSYVINGNAHANYHAWDPTNAKCVAMANAHNHFVHRNVAMVLAKLDSTSFPGPNGKSLLNNLLVAVGSEVGTNHSVVRMFHAIAGGDGRFKLGVNSNAHINAIEFYSAMGKAYGLPKVGDGNGYTTDAPI